MSKLYEKLWMNFIDTLAKSEDFNSYESYYNIIVNWLGNNKDKFDLKTLKDNNLDVLVNINPEKYIIENIDVPPLENEVRRLKNIDLNSKNTIAMILSSTLWDMITTGTDEICPNCGSPDVRLIRVENKKYKKEKIILMCQDCAWEKNVYGDLITDTDCDYLPANKEDIVKLNK